MASDSHDYFLIDNNMREFVPLVLMYIQLAGDIGYKDANIVMPRGLLAEAANRAMDKALVGEYGSSRFPSYISPSDSILKNYSGRIIVPPINEADIDFITGLGDLFQRYLKPEMVSLDDQMRVQEIAWQLKRKTDPDNCPEKPAQMDISDFNDLSVVMALYKVRATFRTIEPHMPGLKKVRNQARREKVKLSEKLAGDDVLKVNSADRSMLAWYEDSLSPILNSREDIEQRKTIFVSLDDDAIRNMKKVTEEHGNQEHYLHFRRTRFIEYMKNELQAAKHYAIEHSVAVPETVMDRFEKLNDLLEDLRMHRSIAETKAAMGYPQL